MTQKPPFPLAWDSTMVKAFRTCPKMFQWEYIHHLKPKGQSVHLVAGKAFASGLEAMRKAYWEQGLDSEAALGTGIQALLKAYGDFDCPIGSPKSASRMAGALEFYHSQYPLGDAAAPPLELTDGKRAIEFSFAIPLQGGQRGLFHPVTGELILYTGRADQVVRWAGGVYPEDDKTTSRLGESWADNWLMRSQFTGYAWAARQMWERVQGVLVTGVAIRKLGYDTMRVPTVRPPHIVERWHEQTVRDIQRAMRMWQDGYWDYNLDESCNNYGKCPFLDPCLSANPEPWLEANYEVRHWDPVTRNEETGPLSKPPEERLAKALEGVPEAKKTRKPVTGLPMGVDATNPEKRPTRPTMTVRSPI